MVKRKDEGSGLTPAALGALMAGDMENALVAMMPGGIEMQEAAGQIELTGERNRMPIRGTTDDPVLRGQWEAVGFRFGREVPHQPAPVFVEATFPLGWFLKPTDHSMWSDVLDEKGRKRASVFFKAAFYDYKAHTSGLSPRYGVALGEVNGVIVCGVSDGPRNVIHTVATYSNWDDYYKNTERDRHRDEAARWLKEHYPECEDPMAYWD